MLAKLEMARPGMRSRTRGSCGSAGLRTSSPNAGASAYGSIKLQVQVVLHIDQERPSRHTLRTGKQPFVWAIYRF